MYEITRTAYDGNGQPMRVTVTVYPADRNQFIVDVGLVPKPSRSRTDRAHPGYYGSAHKSE